ncbi:MAG: hypothetical protein ACOX2M_02185 [Fastidiosipilaceae bacterium]|jgi:hypothetical protein
MTLFTGQLDAPDQPIQPHWPVWDTCRSFQDLFYQPVYLSEIQQALDKAVRAQKWRGGPEHFLTTIEPVRQLYNEYAQARSIAEVCYQMNRSDPFYTAERARYRVERKEITLLIQLLFEGVMADKKFLPEIAEAMGKMPLLTVHNWRAIHHHYVEEQQAEEDFLVEKIQADGEFISELSMLDTHHDWRPPANLPADFTTDIVHLMQVRQELAIEQGFDSFVQLGYRRLSYLDFLPWQAEQLHQYIEDYFVPLASALRAADQESTDIRPGDIFRASITAAPTPSLPTSISEAARINRVFKDSLGEDTGDFWLNLDKLGYIQTFDWKNVERRAKCYRLTDPSLPVLFSNRKLSTSTLADFLNIGGRAYGHLLSSDRSGVYFYQDVPLAVLRIWGKVMEFLGHRGVEGVFEDPNDAEIWRQYHMRSQVMELPLLALIDRFQMYLHQNFTLGVDEWNREWLILVARYFPDLAEDEEWLARQLYSWRGVLSTYTEPFSALSKAVSVVSGLSVWDKARENRELSLAQFDQFCARTLDDSCLLLLEKTGLSSPFEKDTIKRLAFQTCYYLGF